MQARAKLRRLDDNTVVTSYRNTGERSVHDLRLQLTAASAADLGSSRAQAQDAARFGTVLPGETVATHRSLNVPLSAATVTYHLIGRADFATGGGSGDDTPRHEAAVIARSRPAP
ncbi:hypothetical protein ACIA8E_34000 [Streptomyces sp. NPDC051664]|uniref:hypothetical protein n=1 Tax=Streptomyces sp. NPDC051664 TaxID=3365668 RepID=UPI00379BF90E